MKQYTIFLIYATGRLQFGFWVKMDYQEAFSQVINCYDDFIKWKAKLKGRENDKFDTQLLALPIEELIHYYLANQMPETIKV